MRRGPSEYPGQICDGSSVRYDDRPTCSLFAVLIIFWQAVWNFWHFKGSWSTSNNLGRLRLLSYWLLIYSWAGSSRLLSNRDLRTSLSVPVRSAGPKTSNQKALNLNFAQNSTQVQKKLSNSTTNLEKYNFRVMDIPAVIDYVIVQTSRGKSKSDYLKSFTGLIDVNLNSFSDILTQINQGMIFQHW